MFGYSANEPLPSFTYIVFGRPQSLNEKLHPSLRVTCSRPLQKLNMWDMSVTLLVSNFERSSDVRPLHSLNM